MEVNFMTNNDEVPSELCEEIKRELWAAEQALDRLIRKTGSTNK
jgi:hypothetical protein